MTRVLAVCAVVAVVTAVAAGSGVAGSGRAEPAISTRRFAPTTSRG